MTELIPELQHALDTQAPARLVDPRTNEALLEQDDNLSHTYSAQIEAAMGAGWGDASMDDYDRYDELHR